MGLHQDHARNTIQQTGTERNSEGDVEARQGTQRILGYKLLIDELMDPSGSFCHEQSSHLSGLESPGRTAANEDSKMWGRWFLFSSPSYFGLFGNPKNSLIILAFQQFQPAGPAPASTASEQDSLGIWQVGLCLPLVGEACLALIRFSVIPPCLLFFRLAGQLVLP